LFLAAVVVNRNLTALLTLAAGAVIVALVRFRVRALAVGAAAFALVALTVLAVPALRQRAAWISADVRGGNWNAVLSYRLGAWAAALEMARARPLVGFGPGTFAAEFVPHRLRAELRYRQRLTSPTSAGSYSEAHSDYLQGLAEIGVIASAAAVALVAVIFARLWRRAFRAASPAQAEAALLAAVLASFAMAALTWFPLQRAFSAAPLLLVLGRALRVTAEGEASS
jgi:O-antigen ligase